MTGGRCFLCGARAMGPTDRVLAYPGGRERSFAHACGSCGVLVDEAADSQACAAALSHRLSAGAYGDDEEAGYGLDAYTLRIAASAQRRGIEPRGAAQQDALRRPHAVLAARAGLFSLDDAPQTPVSLGICCRSQEVDGVLGRLGAEAGWASRVVILVDGPARGLSAVIVEGFAAGAVGIAARPLEGDFAAQRNALTGLAGSAWMLQLDADETLEPGTGALLGALAYAAERQGVVSIGLRRRNWVDGVLSDVFPDTQYRLNHASIRYGGRVHERPDVDWPRSTIALHGAILHAMAGAHVATRSETYEAMHPGHGRRDERESLLAPYRD